MRSPHMKSFRAPLAVILVAWASAASAAALWPGTAAPQVSPQAVSAPAILRVDGELKSSTGEARTGTVLFVASLYAARQDTTPLWIEQQLVTLDNAGRYTIFVGATLD